MTFDPNALFSHAMSLHQAGSVREAIALYQQLIAHFPDNPEILTPLGTAWLQLGDLSEGVEATVI